MRVLVYPHELSIGGSQINAIDLAAAIRDLGHEATVYGQPGPLASYVTEEKGLRLIEAHDLHYRPAPTRIAQLAQIARRERIDVIHAYEWPPCLDAYLGAALFGGVPVVCTVLSMGFNPMIPSSVPLLMGTEELAAEVRSRFDGLVGVMEPPIDTDRDRPGQDGTEVPGFRDTHAIASDDYLVVSVSRLSLDLKLDALVDAIDAAGRLADRVPLRMVLVGSGDAEPQLRARAEAVNEGVGREVVTLPGPMMDPRAAYAEADVVVGMGSSALRAMAHAKPVVVQGERGFARLFDRDTAPDFFWTGFYGIGPGRSAAEDVADALERLWSDPQLREDLGNYGRDVVVDRFSLARAAHDAVAWYERAISTRAPLSTRLAQSAVMSGRALALEVRLHRPSHKRQRSERTTARLAAASRIGKGST